MHIRTSLYGSLAACVAVLTVCAAAPRASASSLTGDYFTISADNPDVENGIDGGVVTGLVESSLGVNGLPVVSAFGKAYAGPSGPIQDYDPITGEIRWWSPSSPFGVVHEKTQTDTTPLDFTSFFPDGQSGDGPLFRAVHWQGSFDLASPGSVTLSLGADDDAFVFVDNTLRVDAGGVHAIQYVPNVVDNLSAGTHKLDVFFSDRHTVQSGIHFDANVTLTPTAVPEPSSLALLGLALPGLMGLRRRR